MTNSNKQNIKAIVQKKIGSKTIVALVERLFVHPRYGKRIRRTKKVYADNLLGSQAKDTVLLEQTRPLSHLKKWKVIKILKSFGKKL